MVINRVPNDGMVQGCQMGAQLMGPAGSWAKPETRAVLHQLQTTPERDARFSTRMNAVSGRLTLQTRQRETNPSAESLHLSLNISDIQLSDPSRCKQSPQQPVCVWVLRQKHKP